MNFAKQSLKHDGTCMIVEPMANDNLQDNLNLVGRIYYSASTMICVPNSLADNGPALGAQAGEKRIKEIAEKAGFTKFKSFPNTF
jgi:hypothetical protein